MKILIAILVSAITYNSYSVERSYSLTRSYFRSEGDLVNFYYEGCPGVLNHNSGILSVFKSKGYKIEGLEEDKYVEVCFKTPGVYTKPETSPIEHYKKTLERFSQRLEKANCLKLDLDESNKTVRLIHLTNFHKMKTTYSEEVETYSIPGFKEFVRTTPERSHEKFVCVVDKNYLSWPYSEIFN